MPSSVLQVAPPAIGVSSIDPRGVAVECLLRFHRVDYQTAPSSGTPTLTVPTPSTQLQGDSGAQRNGGPLPPLVAKGFHSIHRTLQANNVTGVDDDLSNEARAICSSVEAIAEWSLFPAFDFVVHQDDGLFRGPISKKVVSVVCSLFEVVTGSYRSRKLAGEDPLTGIKRPFQSLADALEVAKSGLQALEGLLAAKGSRITSDAAKLRYFLGTVAPTTADCFAYAAASAFLHSDWALASTEMQKWQAQVRTECRLLVQYVELLRLQHFEDFKGTVPLKPIANLKDLSEADVYAPGRWKVLLTTAAFSFLYFVVVNAGTILELLGGADELVEDGNRAEEKTSQ